MRNGIKAIGGLAALAALCGCACAPVSAGQKSRPDTNSVLEEKDRRIRELEGLLERKNAEITERNNRIEELKEKLRSLGVF